MQGYLAAALSNRFIATLHIFLAIRISYTGIYPKSQGYVMICVCAIGFQYDLFCSQLVQCDTARQSTDSASMFNGCFFFWLLCLCCVVLCGVAAKCSLETTLLHLARMSLWPLSSVVGVVCRLHLSGSSQMLGLTFSRFSAYTKRRPLFRMQPNQYSQNNKPTYTFHSCVRKPSAATTTFD